MENIFDQFDVSQENPFDQFDLNTPSAAKNPAPRDDNQRILPSFLDFDTPEAKEKRDQLLQEDPEQFIRILARGQQEGLKRGILDIGEGFKQLALEASDLMRFDPDATKQAEEYTQKIEKERTEFEETYGLFPGNKINRFIGANAPFAYLPVKMPSSLFARVAASSGLGGAITGTQFVPEGGSRTINTLTGLAVGGAVPSVAKAISKTYSWSKNILVDPFTKKGAYEDIAKFLRTEIAENRGKIEQAVKDSIGKGENKTVAQIIAENTQGSSQDFGGILVRLEKDLSRESDALKSLYAMQSGTRTAAIDSITGTQDDLIKAIEVRSKRAAMNYSIAYDSPLKADNNLSKIANNKYFQVALKDAKDLAQAKGINEKDNLTEFLHYTKEGLDKQLNATDAAGKTALGREEIKVIQKMKTDLVDWIGKKNPSYEQARAQFQKDSIPVNRMEIGNELKKAYTNALDRETPAAFAKALQESQKTIKKAIGFGGAKKFDDILTQKQVADLIKLRKELVVEAQKKKMAGESKAIFNKLTGDASISLPHILSRPIVIANHALKALGKDRTPEYKKLLIDVIQDPAQFLKAYKLPEKNQRARMAIDIIERLEIIAGSNAMLTE